jgi:hypothetical protein
MLLAGALLNSPDDLGRQPGADLNGAGLFVFIAHGRSTPVITSSGVPRANPGRDAPHPAARCEGRGISAELGRFPRVLSRGRLPMTWLEV